MRDLMRRSGFRRLLAVRMATQFADGAFEGSLAILFFFSPERARTPGGIALAFAVLTLPFTLVGPWAGVPLDRWSRRDTLVLGSVVRGALVASAALLLGTGHAAVALYAVALAVVSVNRFLLSAISAGLPHVVPDAELVTANAVAPTLGTVASTLGAAGAYAGIAAGAPTSVVLAGVAVVLAGTAAVFLTLRRGELGPDPGEREAARQARPLRGVTTDMVSGLAYLRGRTTAATALAAMTAHRLFFGAATLATILILRGRFGADSDGLSAGASVVAALSVGLFAAALATPGWVRRSNPTVVGGTALVGMGLVLVALVVGLGPWQLGLVAVVVGWGGQSLKICVDTIVQRDVADGYRGRVFSIYDVLFNLAFLVAMVVLAPFLPADGYSAVLFAVLAAGYLAAAAGYLRSTWQPTGARRAASPL